MCHEDQDAFVCNIRLLLSCLLVHSEVSKSCFEKKMFLLNFKELIKAFVI